MTPRYRPQVFGVARKTDSARISPEIPGSRGSAPGALSAGADAPRRNPDKQPPQCAELVSHRRGGRLAWVGWAELESLKAVLSAVDDGGVRLAYRCDPPRHRSGAAIIVGTTNDPPPLAE